MKKSIFLFFAAILCAMNASAWSYKTAANNWTASTSGFKSVTMNSGKKIDVVMLKDVGDGVNICQNDNGSGHTLYCKWTKASGDIFRGTARWNNGLYCDETVVVPGGKVYIKVGSGTQVQMTAGADYTYTADVTFSTTGQSYTISGGTVSGATIKSENSMPSGGKPASLTMKNSYTSKTTGNVHIVFDLRTNKVTETAEEPEAPEPIETTTLYYVNSGEWSSVNAYVWVAESNESYKPWSGEAATKTDKTVYDEANDKTYDVYSYTFPITYNRVIFNGDGKQTQDAEAVYDAAKPYLCNAVWYESLDAVKEALKKPIPDETVYFINTGKWSKVMIYTWNGSGATSWPGVEMTKTSEVIGEYEVYSYTAKKGGQANLLFQESEDVNKTADQTWQAGKYYAPLKNKWYDTKEAAAEDLAAPVEYEYVYLINTNDWAKALIYTWTPEVASYPGAAMTKESEQIAGKDVYSYKVVKGSTFGGLNFNCGGDECKTGDLAWEAGKYYAPSKDKWYDTKEAAAEALAAPTVNTYTVVGSSAPLFGEAWAAAKAENDMTLVEGTKYELVKTDVSLTGGAIQYKVAVNHAWDEAYPAENAILNISEAGKYTVTFTFDSNTKAVGATAKLEEAVVVLPTVGVKGAWDGWAATTTLTGDNTSASATVNIATAGVYEFGLDVDGNFQASGATIDKANNSTVVTTNAGNMKLKANVLGDYTFTWTYETNTLTVTYPVGEEIDLNKYYVIGLSGNWDIVPANELVLVSVGSKEYSLVANMTAGTHEFKVSDATKDNTYGYAQLTKKNYNELSEGEYSNIKLTLAANAEVTITFNGETKAITLTSTALTENTTALTYTVTVPAGTAKCYICGAWDWNTFMKMTPTANANEFTIDIVGATTGQEYKYTCGEGWEYAEVNADGSTRANRTYNANDVVEKWADVITYVLMGVNNDWTTGIPMTKDGDQYVCKDVTIDGVDDAVKVVTLTNGTATAWYNSLDNYSNTYYYLGFGEDDNLVLNGGVYDFYFKLNEEKIYIEQKVYTRKVTNKYGTICLPYASASTSGAYFYEVVGQEAGKVYLGSVNALKAGVPYIFEKTAGEIKVVYDMTKGKKDAQKFNGLCGYLGNTSATVELGGYILLNNEFRPSDGSARVRAFRAYLNLAEVTVGAPTQMPGRRYIGMDVQGENEATGVEDLFSTDAPVKVIENGQLIIIRDGVKYNVQGQKL